MAGGGGREGTYSARSNIGNFWVLDSVIIEGKKKETHQFELKWTSVEACQNKRSSRPSTGVPGQCREGGAEENIS